MRIEIQDVREAGRRMRADGSPFCLHGIKTWCRHHGIDVRRLIREGIPSAELDGNDLFVREAIRAAELRHGR